MYLLLGLAYPAIAITLYAIAVSIYVGLGLHIAKNSMNMS